MLQCEAGESIFLNIIVCYSMSLFTYCILIVYSVVIACDFHTVFIVKEFCRIKVIKKKLSHSSLLFTPGVVLMF